MYYIIYCTIFILHIVLCIIYCNTYYNRHNLFCNVLVIIISEICLFIIFLYFYIVDVRLTAHELGDHHEIYKQCLQGTTSDLPEWMIESQWSEGGPRDGSGGYLTFSLASFLVLLLILSGDIELNPGPETVRH